MLFKFGKWVEYSRVHPRASSGSRDRFWDEATLFKFRKCIDYGECHIRGLKFLSKTDGVSVTGPLFKF